jgi:lipopolysaccharide export system permease protein
VAVVDGKVPVTAVAGERPLRWRNVPWSLGLAKYLFREIVPSFLLGTLLFVLILLLFQAIRLMEFVIGNQVPLRDVGALSLHLMMTFLPVAIPVSFLFAVLMAISRAQSEGELMALQVSGTSLRQVLLPVLVLGALVALLAAQLSLYRAPRSNRAFELLITKLGSERVVAQVKSGVFNTGFHGMTLYAEQVKPLRSELERVFLYDERDEARPLAIVADAGVLRQIPEKGRLLLRLSNGAIHPLRTQFNAIQQKIEFDLYDIYLDIAGSTTWTRPYSMPSFDYPQLRDQLAAASPSSIPHRRLRAELHRRYALSFSAIVFAALGFATALRGRRGVRSGAIVLCLFVGLVYWLSFLASNAVALRGSADPRLIVWAPNAAFLLVAFLAYRKFRSG